jgi:6,7-dimethyl-8-ribityllumazine synthase
MSNYKTSLKNIENLDKDIKIAFVTWEFNRNYTKQLEDVNEDFLIENWFKNIDRFLVPWVFEIPWFTRKVLDEWDYDLIICFWVVIRWDTPHFDYVCNESSRWIMNLSMEYDTPIIFWILTCNNDDQVKERITPNYAISWLNLLAEIDKI